MLLSSGLSTAPCGCPASGVHCRASSRMPAFRNDSISDSTRPSAIFVLQASHQDGRAGSCRSIPSGRRPPRGRSRPSAVDRPAATRLCIRVPDGTRSSVPRSRARRSVRSRSRSPPGPRGRAPWECPTVAFPSIPAWGCARVEWPGADTCRLRSWSDSSQMTLWQSAVQTPRPSRDPRPRPLSFAATCWNAANRFRSANTLSNSRNHFPPSTPCSRVVNMRTVQTHGFDPSPTREGSLRLVEPAALSPVVASVCLVIRHPSSWSPSLPRRYPASSLLWLL